MANTYTSLHYHIVFSTKNRERWLAPEIEERIWAYIGGIEDHVHVLLSASPTVAPSKIAQLLKGGSSSWIRTTFPSMRAFAWQDGYGAFTVSKSVVREVVGYIQNQREHHKSRTFQEEYVAILKKHQIDYNDRYVWD